MALHMDLDPVAPEADVARRVTPVVECDLEANRLAVPRNRDHHVANLDDRVGRNQARHVWNVSGDDWPRRPFGTAPDVDGNPLMPQSATLPKERNNSRRRGSRLATRSSFEAQVRGGQLRLRRAFRGW